MGDVVAEDNLQHSVHVMIDFSTIREVRRHISRTAALDLERTDFGLFRCVFDETLGRQS